MDNNNDKKVGAVLVQGAGIAGVQASLDLANSGFKVYLVERDAAIGGMMVPTFTMPEAMQTISKISPHAWALMGYQDVIVRAFWTGSPCRNCDTLKASLGISKPRSNVILVMSMRIYAPVAVSAPRHVP